MKQYFKYNDRNQNSQFGMKSNVCEELKPQIWKNRHVKRKVGLFWLENRFLDRSQHRITWSNTVISLSDL